MEDKINLENWKAQNEANLAHYQAIWNYDLDSYRATNHAGQSALKANVFLNAGAAVASLAFLANIYSKSIQQPLIEGIIYSIMFFALGALLGSIATGFVYLGMSSMCEEKTKFGNILNIIANALVVAAYNLFVIGCYNFIYTISNDLDFEIKFGWVSIIFLLVVIDIGIIYIVKLALTAKKGSKST